MKSFTHGIRGNPPAEISGPGYRGMIMGQPLHIEDQHQYSSPVFQGLPSATRDDNPSPKEQLFLLYHELHDLPCPYRYAIPKDLFRQHLAVLSQARADESSMLRTGITFDDGYLSDYSIALPLLVEAGISARFFITVGWTGKRESYMSWEHLRELVRHGQKIGAHSWSHRFLSHCTPQELRWEVERSKKVLEDKLGVAVDEMSLPGGRMNQAVLTACQNAGYKRVFTSSPKVDDRPTFTPGRINVLNTTTTRQLEAWMRKDGKAVRRLHTHAAAKNIVKAVLGDSLYVRLWGLLNASETPAVGLHESERV